jgi:probable F420-dependent oxidoreductase
MAVALEATESIRVGCRVLCNDYRHPVILAKEVATLDLFSEGRVEMGLGAGWLANEYEAAGIPFDSPGTRIARLEEAIAVIKAHMGDGTIDHAGTYYNVSGFEGVPKPVQRPHPPIMIGGGSPKILRLAGREAQIVSLNFDNSSGVIGPQGVQRSTAEATAEKMGWIREGAGDRFDDLEIEIGAYFTVVTDHVQKTAEAMAPMFGLSTEQMLELPHALIGTVDGICEELERRREAYGISYVTVNDANAVPFAPVVERLSGK